MHRTLLLGLIPALAFAAVLTSSGAAHAGPYIGVDLDLGTAFQDHVDFSYGLGGRFGYKLYFSGAPVWLQPEVGGHFMSFGSGTQFGHAGAFFGGARFGLDGSSSPMSSPTWASASWARRSSDRTRTPVSAWTSRSPASSASGSRWPTTP
jgi:hypothetical protein